MWKTLVTGTVVCANRHFFFTKIYILRKKCLQGIKSAWYQNGLLGPRDRTFLQPDPEPPNQSSRESNTLTLVINLCDETPQYPEPPHQSF